MIPPQQLLGTSQAKQNVNRVRTENNFLKSFSLNKTKIQWQMQKVQTRYYRGYSPEF